MSRTINESLEQLRTSLGDIKTSLSSKLSGGSDLGNIKVSEVAGYIDQIETGGGGSDLTGSDYSDYCIIMFELRGTNSYTTDITYSIQSTCTPIYYFDSLYQKDFFDDGDLFYIGIFELKDEPQTIKIDTTFEDESKRYITSVFNNVDISKAGFFYYYPDTVEK